MADLDIEQIRATWQAATPGPYRWAGNTDYGDVRLAAAGGSEVFGLIDRDRSHDDPESRAYAEHLRDIQVKIDGEFRRLTDDEITDWVHRSIVAEEDDGDGGEVMRTYKALAFYAPGRAYEHAVDHVTYEVTRYQDLPEDTPRSHPRIYRADVVDVRNPNARFLRASWESVDRLLAEVDRLTAENARLRAAATPDSSPAAIPTADALTDEQVDQAVLGASPMVVDPDVNLTVSAKAREQARRLFALMADQMRRGAEGEAAPPDTSPAGERR